MHLYHIQNIPCILLIFIIYHINNNNCNNNKSIIKENILNPSQTSSHPPRLLQSPPSWPRTIPELFEHPKIPFPVPASPSNLGEPQIRDFPERFSPGKRGANPCLGIWEIGKCTEQSGQGEGIFQPWVELLLFHP